jgi:rhamnogalacturonyl hydrolase YesR
MIGCLPFCWDATVQTAEQSTAAADIILQRRPDANSVNPRNDGWNRAVGYCRCFLEKVWRATGRQLYLAYIRRHVDFDVDRDGQVPDFGAGADAVGVVAQV